MGENSLGAMSSLEIRPATAADLPIITEIYEHAVRHGTATFELIPPDLAEMTRRFRALADGGQVRMPLTKTFWSPRFGMVADRFGLGWMISVMPAGQH